MKAWPHCLRMVSSAQEGTFRRLFIWRLLVLACLAGCWPGKAQAFRLLTASGSPYLIEQDLLVPAGDTLYLSPGATLHFSEGAKLVVEGTLLAFGTAEMPVVMALLAPEGPYSKLILRKPGSTATMRHVRMEGIRIQTLDTDLILQHVEFHRRKTLPMSEATLMFRKGKLFVDQCAIYGNGTGEGLIIIKGRGKVRVQNSYFEQVADAVEYITVDSGSISGNVFLATGNPDDAIDLNNCKGVEIRHNHITGYPDCGIEISSDNFGPCQDILIRGNVIQECKTGLLVKQGSEATAQGNLFLRNRFGVQCNDEGEAGKRSKVHLRNCWLLGTRAEDLLSGKDQVMQAWTWLIRAS